MTIGNQLFAAEYLEGVELPGGWVVQNRISPGATGGSFGVPYIVKNSTSQEPKTAFLKALNLRNLDYEVDFARALQRHITAFNFERDILTICKDKKLRRIARLIDAGQHRLPSCQFPICYIIFEIADHGDVRTHLSKVVDLDLTWRLTTLHQICVAMQQLHVNGIAHQDVKPSNILIFKEFGAKIGDMGCADARKMLDPSPRGDKSIAGDPTYAPPELMYNEVSSDWHIRRLGCDLYLIASIIVYLFTEGGSLTALWRKRLSFGHQPMSWPFEYRGVLPHVRAAYNQAIEEFSLSVPESIRSDIVEIVQHLSDPDPLERGHPHDRRGNRFNLERFISKLDLLAKKSEYRLLA